MQQALDDIAVVELGSGHAASWCGKVFADLGAHVVKVEPPGGDRLRAAPGSFAHLNTNKHSIVIEPSPAAATELWSLLSRADLVVEAPGQGALADWGIDREEVLARCLGVSVVAITGFGVTGPYADYAWSDLVAQAFGGFMLNDPERGPLKLPMSVEEYAVGHTAALGALAAIMRSRASGIGAFVDCAAVEALASPPNRIGRFLGWEYHGRVVNNVHAAGTGAGRSLLPNGFFPCADGHVAIMMTPQQLNEMLATLGSDELAEAFARPDAFARPETAEIVDGVIYPWMLERTRAEITLAAQAAGWPVTGVNLPEEVLDADHLHQRGFWVHAHDEEHGPLLLPGPPYRFTEGGWKLRSPAPRLGTYDPLHAPPPDAAAKVRPAPRDPVAPPLQGLRVLDITTVWSGPFLTLLLADLGAEVIRVETPHVFPPTTKGYSPRPDPQILLGAYGDGYGPLAPGRPDRPYNRHSMNNSVARGKLSCTLDVRLPEQRELFMRLVAESDVFVENLKSTTLHQMGIHETELLARNPRMIVMRIPPAGLSGDWAHYTGFGAQFDGLSGLASLCGHRGTDLMESPATMHMDSVTGPAGAFALLAALHYRDATGRGQLLELAQMENVISQLGDVFIDLQLGTPAERLGNRDRSRAPQGIYRCADGRWLALCVTDDFAWAGLTQVMGRIDLGSDVELAHVAGRQAAHDDLDIAIGEWAGTVLVLDAFRALQEAGVAAAPVTDDPMIAADPQVVAREWFRPLASADVGTFNHFGHAFRGIPLVWERGAPTLGQDNEYVFKKILGLDDAAYKRLVADRIATEDYLDPHGNPY